MAFKDALLGESGMVLMLPRRMRWIALPFALVMSMWGRAGVAGWLVKDGTTLATVVGIGVRPSGCCGPVVVKLVIGDTVTWAGLAPAGLHRSPGMRWRRGALVTLGATLVAAELEADVGWEEVAGGCFGLVTVTVGVFAGCFWVGFGPVGLLP